jgi:hypothetical protein
MRNVTRKLGVIVKKTYTRRISRDLRSFSILSTLEQLLVLPNIQIICSGEISPTSEPESKLRVVESVQNIRDDRLFINIDTENLSLLVDTNNTIRGFMFRGDEHRLARNPIHVNTSTGFEVVEVNEPIFRNEIDYSMLLRHLHSNWEIVGSLGREIDIDSFLDKGRIGRGVVYFDYM